jgi:hypothetical protein
MDEQNDNNLLNNVKSGIKWIVKPTIGKKGFEQTTEDVKNSYKSLYFLFKRYFLESSSDSKLDELKKISDYKERFNDSMRIQNVKTSDLPEVEKIARFKFNIDFFLLVLMLGYLIASNFGFIGGNIFVSFASILFGISLMALLLARFVRSSFHLYQVKLKALVPFNYWLKDYSAWLGGTPSGNFTSFLIFGFLCMSGFHSAFADMSTASSSTSLSTVMSWLQGNGGVIDKTNDLSIQMLTSLFPSGMPSTYQTSQANNDIFVPMFQVFNSIILAIASGMMAYQTVIGTVQTAHEGQVLGQKWSTAFAPVRICLGVGSLAPIKGYCLAQLFAIQVLIAGYAVANGMWGVYLDATLGGGITVNSLPNPPSKGSIVSDLLLSEICLQDKRVKNQNAWFFTDPTADIEPQLTTNSTSVIIDYGTDCGTLSFTLPTIQSHLNGIFASNENNDEASQSVPLSDNWLSRGISNTTSSLVTDAEQAGSNASYAALHSGIDATSSQSSNTIVADLAKEFSNNLKDIFDAIHSSSTSSSSDSSLASAIVQAVSAGSTEDQVKKAKDAVSLYEGLLSKEAILDSETSDMVTKALTNETSDYLNTFKTKSKQLGWASAGALNPIIMKVGYDQLQALQMAQPNYIRPRNLDPKLEAVFSAITNSATHEYSPQSESTVSIEKSISAIFGENLSTDFTSFKLDALNPMQTIQNEGNNILIAGQACFLIYLFIMATVAVAEGVAETPELKWLGSGIVGSMAKLVMQLLPGLAGSLIGWMILIGCIETYVIPAIPYILWLYAVLGCAAFAVEFVVAAPLAAFMHVRLDGDELIGQQQKPFYSLLFNGTMRPTLLLFGLIAANKVFSVIATFMNETFSVAFTASNTGTLVGICGILTSWTLIMYIHYNLAVKCLELINRVPHMVTQMVGIQDHFEDPSRTTTEVKGAIVNMNHQASNTLSGGLGAIKPRSKESGKKTYSPGDQSASSNTDPSNSDGQIH